MGKVGKREGEDKAKNGGADSAQDMTPQTAAGGGTHDSVILAELRKLREEHTEAAGENKKALTRLEANVTELMGRMTALEKRSACMEDRLGKTDDRTMRLERSAAFLLHQTAKLTAKCDDMESRQRRNNIRIHGIPEGAEKDEAIGFVTSLIKSVLQLPDDMEINIERAHRSLAAKPKDRTAPPRAIIVRFLDYKVKDYVIRQAWKQKTTYEGQNIYFNQDYTAEVQKKRKQVRDVIKKLKEKNVKAQSPYPAQLKIFLDSGTKTFTTLTEAAPMLKDMGIYVEEDRMEGLRQRITKEGWGTATGRKRRQNEPHITEEDIQALTEENRQ